MSMRLRGVGVAVALSLQAACGGTPTRGQPDLLEFIADGSTARSEVVARLGEPGRRLQTGHICTYRIGHDKSGQFVVRDADGPYWAFADASLVLVFDDSNVLRRHALIPTHEP